jgi:hypothetical protein
VVELFWSKEKRGGGRDKKWRGMRNENIWLDSI